MSDADYPTHVDVMNAIHASRDAMLADIRSLSQPADGELLAPLRSLRDDLGDLGATLQDAHLRIRRRVLYMLVMLICLYSIAIAAFVITAWRAA